MDATFEMFEVFRVPAEVFIDHLVVASAGEFIGGLRVVEGCCFLEPFDRFEVLLFALFIDCASLHVIDDFFFTRKWFIFQCGLVVH